MTFVWFCDKTESRGVGGADRFVEQMGGVTVMISVGGVPPNAVTLSRMAYPEADLLSDRARQSKKQDRRTNI